MNNLRKIEILRGCSDGVLEVLSCLIHVIYEYFSFWVVFLYLSLNSLTSESDKVMYEAFHLLIGEHRLAVHRSELFEIIKLFFCWLKPYFGQLIEKLMTHFFLFNLELSEFFV